LSKKKKKKIKFARGSFLNFYRAVIKKSSREVLEWSIMIILNYFMGRWI